MKLRPDRLSAGLLMLAAALQASYVVLNLSLRLTPVMLLATAVIGGFGLHRAVISRKPCELMLLTVITVYFGVLAMCFSGRSLPDFLTNPFSLVLFILFAAAIPQMAPVILLWRRRVAWMAMTVAVIHLSFIAMRGIDVLTLLGGGVTRALRVGGQHEPGERDGGEHRAVHVRVLFLPARLGRT